MLGTNWMFKLQDVLRRDPMTMPRVSLYGAGPPCQAVSNAGKKRGLEPQLNLTIICIWWHCQNVIVMMVSSWNLCEIRLTRELNVTQQSSTMLNWKSLMWCCLRWWNLCWIRDFGKPSSESGWICVLACSTLFLVKSLKLCSTSKSQSVSLNSGFVGWWMAMDNHTTTSMLQCWMPLTMGFLRQERGCSSLLWGEASRWSHSSFHPHGKKKSVFQWLWTRSSVVGRNDEES